METMFSWTKPSENNRLSFFLRFSELNLFIIIAEIKIMMGLFIEESVNIYNIILKNTIVNLVTNIIIKWRDINRRVFRFWDTS